MTDRRPLPPPPAAAATTRSNPTPPAPWTTPSALTPPANPQPQSGSRRFAAPSSARGGGEPVVRPGTRPPSPPKIRREMRLMLAALASGELQPTPEVLEKLRQYEEAGARWQYERHAWTRARDQDCNRAEAASRRGQVERTMFREYGYDRQAFQYDAKRARGEPSSSAAAAGHGSLDKSVSQAKELIQIDDVGLAKPVLGLGTELPDRSQSMELHQNYTKVNQLQQACVGATAGAMAGGCCQHEKMMLYEDELLKDFAEFKTILQEASSGATAGGGGPDRAGVGLNQKLDRLVRQANERMQGMVEIMTPQFFSKDFVHAPLLEFVGRYPKWLEANRDKLSKEEYEQYERQLELMVNLTVIYENEPQNFFKIANIMLKIQERGMPPNDIVADIFPGLDLNTMRQQLPGRVGQGCCIL